MVAAITVVACGGTDDGAERSGSDDTATVDEDPTSVAAEPEVDAAVDPETAVRARLTEELGDDTVVDAVVDGVDDAAWDAFHQAVDPEQIATTPVLTYRPDTVPGPVDHLVVLAFGNRLAEDGTTTPGPTNEALADAVAAYVADHPTAVYAQWEVARGLEERGVPDVVSIEPEVGPDGEVVYLSTSGVTDAVVARAAADGIELGTVGVVGFADHVVRCVATAAASGMDAVVVEGVDLPADYDPESGQEWTRDRVTYLITDLASRIATL